jgi:hypothetical protein
MKSTVILDKRNIVSILYIRAESISHTDYIINKNKVQVCLQLKNKEIISVGGKGSLEKNSLNNRIPEEG